MFGAHVHGCLLASAQLACRFLWNKSSKEYQYYENKLQTLLRSAGYCQTACAMSNSGQGLACMLAHHSSVGSCPAIAPAMHQPLSHGLQGPLPCLQLQVILLQNLMITTAAGCTPCAQVTRQAASPVLVAQMAAATDPVMTDNMTDAAAAGEMMIDTPAAAAGTTAPTAAGMTVSKAGLQHASLLHQGRQSVGQPHRSICRTHAGSRAAAEAPSRTRSAADGERRLLLLRPVPALQLVAATLALLQQLVAARCLPWSSTCSASMLRRLKRGRKK
jgi:hypothetical protein